MQVPGGFQQPPQKQGINFSILTEAFELIKPHWLNLSLFTLVATIPIGILLILWLIIFFGATISNQNSPELSGAFIATFYGSYFIVVLIMYAFIGPIMGSLTNMVTMIMKGETPTLADGFSNFKRFLPLALLGLIQVFLTMLGTLACFIGTLVVAGILMPIYAIQIHEKLSVTDTIRKSFELMKDHWLMASILYVLIQLVLSAASYVCFFPIFFAIPWAAAVFTLLYRDLTGNLTPPNPSQTNYPRNPDASMPNYNNPPAPPPTQ